MTPAEIIAVVERMPLSPASRAALLRAALAGDRWSLLIVRMHAWRQRQAAPRSNTWLACLWARWWK